MCANGNLDVDDTSGLGPETITLDPDQYVDQTYILPSYRSLVPADQIGQDRHLLAWTSAQILEKP